MSRLPIGPVPGRPRRPRRLWRWALAAVVLGLLLARWFFVELVVVRGNTGAPTALEGDVLLVVRRAEPAQGDVVLLEHEGREVLRRVIALPGQTVGADEGVLTIDDVPLATRVVGTFAYRELSDGDRARRQQHFIESLPDGRRHRCRNRLFQIRQYQQRQIGADADDGVGQKRVDGAKIAHAQKGSQNARSHPNQAGGAPLVHNTGAHNHNRHPENTGMAGHLQRQPQPNLGDHHQRRKQRQQNQLKGRKVTCFHRLRAP